MTHTHQNPNRLLCSETNRQTEKVRDVGVRVIHVAIWQHAAVTRDFVRWETLSCNQRGELFLKLARYGKTSGTSWRGHFLLRVSAPSLMLDFSFSVSPEECHFWWAELLQESADLPWFRSRFQSHRKSSSSRDGNHQPKIIAGNYSESRHEFGWNKRYLVNPSCQMWQSIVEFNPV